MIRILLKVLITAIVITTVSEIGKRSSAVAAILAALPLTSILAMIWLYWDTGDVTRVADLSTGIFWAVLPSFIFFLALPLLLKNGVRFSLAMVLACAAMVAGYGVYVWGLRKFGVSL